MRVLFVTSEVFPYSKTGGLGDVAGALPQALHRLGCDIAVVTPRYSGSGARPGDVISRSVGELVLTDLAVPFGGGHRIAAVWRDYRDGVPIYFIEHDDYFGRGYIYGSGDFDAERFAFFSRAALELARRIGAPPDLIHCHDWQTGFVPAYLATTLAGDQFFARTGSLFTIHNLAYQGIFSPALLGHFGLGHQAFERGMEFHRAANAMKAGLSFSTALSTVSPRYAQEIQTPEFGNQLDGLLRWRRNDLIGILNGVDYDEWNPATDQALAANFTADSPAGKRECKRDLLARYHLPADPDRPVIAIVSRLTAQKGLDLVAAAIWRILDTGARFILLGSGDSQYEGFFQHVRDSRPDQVGVYFGFNTALSHQIEAGADLFLMASAYEPCGLNQMYSLRYGTVPIVRGVGGLDDSVQDFDLATLSGNGFKFHGYSADRLLEKVYEALLVYYEPDVWRRLQLNGMREDFSWERSARRYLEAYHQIVAVRRAT
ncbi:MAG: glycogen synthase GlgA [Acidobacteria bacterium]|nr:glycogen synthase GlgA [Acidobacteriota bacterium]